MKWKHYPFLAVVAVFSLSRCHQLLGQLIPGRYLFFQHKCSWFYAVRVSVCMNIPDVLSGCSNVCMCGGKKVVSISECVAHRI